MHVEVTQEDIDAGIRDMCSGCPVARAVRRAANTRTARVDYERIGILSGDKILVYFVPPDVSKIIRDYDEQVRPMQPFSFNVEVNHAYTPSELATLA